MVWCKVERAGVDVTICSHISYRREVVVQKTRFSIVGCFLQNVTAIEKKKENFLLISKLVSLMLINPQRSIKEKEIY